MQLIGKVGNEVDGNTAKICLWLSTLSRVKDISQLMKLQG